MLLFCSKKGAGGQAKAKKFEISDNYFASVSIKIKIDINQSDKQFCYSYGRCSSELAQLVPLPYCSRRSTCCTDRYHDFPVTILRCYKDVYVNSFFPRTATLWTSLPIEFFLLTYDLNGFKSRINRQAETKKFIFFEKNTHTVR